MNNRLKIEKLVYGGYGMGRLEGKAVFVPFTAPGDLVEVKIVQSHKTYDYAVAKKIIEPAGCRVEPLCKHFGTCGGCHLQHMNYATQILWKQLILEEQLSRVGGIDEPNVLPTISSPVVWEYRNRIQVHKRGSSVGFLERESDKVVDVDYCPIAKQEVNKKLKSARTKWPTEDDRLEISPNESPSFSQINPYVNELLKRLVVDWAKEGPLDNILELYAGSGNLTFPLAKVAKEIVAVESDPAACESILRPFDKLRAQGERIKAECVTVEDFLNSPSFVRNDFNLILLDPPRDGLSKEAIKGILKLKAPRILYVSCNPSTLARDVKRLKKSGYVLKRTQPLDMFPETYHIESVSEMTR